MRAVSLLTAKIIAVITIGASGSRVAFAIFSESYGTRGFTKSTRFASTLALSTSADNYCTARERRIFMLPSARYIRQLFAV